MNVKTKCKFLVLARYFFIPNFYVLGYSCINQSCVQGDTACLIAHSECLASCRQKGQDAPLGSYGV